MITVKIGNMFESEAQTLVNTVNCVGVMGKGIALEFRKRFPDMFEDYAKRCKAGEVRIGEPYLFRRLIAPWILNFPTKDDWRAVSHLSDIEKGLQCLKVHYKEWGITSLAIPPLGCGHGQLEWRVVGPTLYRYLKEYDIPVELYAPFGTPHEELAVEFLDGAAQSSATASLNNQYRIEPAWIAVVEILSRIEREPYRWPVGRTMFQKIAYFATESGIPTGLEYQRGSFGPFTADLKRRIAALVNNGLICEEQLGRMFNVRVGRTYRDALRAYKNELDRWLPAIEKVADLFVRMNTHQAEVAGTVHFAAKELKKSGAEYSERDILRAVMDWKQKRRPPLSETDVARTIRHLNMLSWIGAKVSDDLPVAEDDTLVA